MSLGPAHDYGPASGSRAQLCADAAQQWAEELAGLGGRDPLLSFRDLKVGTLDLAAADPTARRRLMDGEPVPISKLFPHDPLRSSALRSARAIRDKGRELAEERGIAGTRLAVGIATWADPFAAHRPTAPVLLRSATVAARDPAETDFVITIADDPVVNPVLIHALDTRLGLRFTADDLRDHYGNLRYPTVVEKLHEYAPAHVVDGFSIAHRAILATFATEPLVLSQDIAHLGTTLQDNDVVAALAGDHAARATLWVQPRRVPIEFQTLPLDSEQRAVVEAIVGGASIHVDAPPGTGHTQTVAAAVADLVGRGKRVLVVGQKKVTLTDLVTRLASIGLRDAVVDLTTTSGADAVEQVVQTARELVTGSSKTGDTTVRRTDRQADAARTVEAYAEALHRPRSPWDISAWQALVAVATAPAAVRTSARIPADVLPTTPDLALTRARLYEFVAAGGLTLNADESPWFGSDIRDTESVDEAMAIVTDLRSSAVPALRDAATRAAVEVGLAGPTSLADCLAVVDLLAGVESTVGRFGPEIWNEPLDDLAVATSDRATAGDLGLFTRRSLRQRARELTGDSRSDRSRTHRSLEHARRIRDDWARRSRGAKRPRTGPHLPAAMEAAGPVRRLLARLAEINPRTSDLIDAGYEEVGARLRALVDDAGHLHTMPRLRELQAALSAAGVDDVIDDLRGRDLTRLGEDVDVHDVLGYAQFASLLDLWRAADPVLRDTDPETVERALRDVHEAEGAAIAAAAARVRSARAARVAQVAADVEGQTAVLAGPDSRVMPRSLHELVDAAPDLALAATPVWVMSPLAVAQWLPAQRLFDVVIVEDAGRVAVAQAVPALARARQVVLVGDDEIARTSFTTAVERPAASDDSDSPWGDEPDPSVVDALHGVLPPLGLCRQYRVRDDSLVGFAARTIYTGRMKPVPGVRGHGRLGMELVEAPDGGDDPVDSSSAEVARVVDLVLAHVRTRPHESLGVVTLGPRHADRIDAALRRALIRSPDVAGYLHESRAEPFFVKDVERVGGDVRDAIILSLGYGRSIDGRILYRFGALGRPGGERRLASATTRARERLTVVSTFGADDLSPRRLTTPGAQALGEFLAYVQRSVGSGGTGDLDDVDTSAVDRLAEAIVARLVDAGAEVEVGVGGSGGIPVAVRHPARRQRFVLAVLTDGPDHVPAGGDRRPDRFGADELRRMGWSVHRVWAAAWAADPDRETQRLLDAYEAAVADADAYDWAVAAAEADLVAGVPDEVESTRPPRADVSRRPETTSAVTGAVGDPPTGSGDAGEAPDEADGASTEESGEESTGEQSDTIADEPTDQAEPGGEQVSEPSGQPTAASDAQSGSSTGHPTGEPNGSDAESDSADSADRAGTGTTGETAGSGEAAAATQPADDSSAGDPSVDDQSVDDSTEPRGRAGSPPPLPHGRPVGDYSGRDLASVARWIESDGVRRDEAEVVALLREHLDLADDQRTHDVARHAVQVARAGAPAYRGAPA